MITRRRLLKLAAMAPRLAGQGMASRGVRPAPRKAATGIPPGTRLVDVAAHAGLRAPTIYGGVDGKEYIVETMGCGAVFFDYDNDGWLDIFLPCGSRLEGAPPGTTNHLYKNNRDGTFIDVTAASGLAREGWALGATVGDYNNDGYEDLFLTYWGQNVLYRNNGDGTFTDVTREAGLLNSEPRFGAGCTFVDYDRDGHLDLFISHYLKFDLKTTPRKGRDASCNWKGVPVHCGPRGLPVDTHLLYHNNGDGTFTDVSVRSGVAKVRGTYGLTVAAADFDEDGWPDIYVAGDSTPSLLFRNNRDGTFTENALRCGVALSEDGGEQAGMGLGIGDYNLDGRLDILKTHFAGDTPTLYRNGGKARFRDVTTAAGLGVETRFVCWGAGMVDLDNDGYPDLFVVTGDVYPELEKEVAGHSLRTPRLMYRNLGDGTFEEFIEAAGPGVAAAHCSRGCAFGDFDNDGDLDILIVNLNEPPSLLRNEVAGAHHWLKLKLIGTRSNRSAIGARVRVSYAGKQQVQEVMAQSSYLSVNERRLHFGLGSVETANVEIRWPSGAVETFDKVKAGLLTVIKEGAGIVSSAALPGFSSRQTTDCLES
jgi:hypothetical protein